MNLTVACAQIAPKKGQLSANLDVIADTIVQAAEEGADLVVFPETATTGYIVQSATFELSITTESLRAELATRLSSRLTKSVDAVIGFYETDNGTLYNSAAYIEFSPEASTLRGAYRKFFLATYGVFDDERYVTRGTEFGAFETRFGKVGMLICEDVWHSISATLTALDGARMILVLSASPGRGFWGEDVDNHDRYRRMIRGTAEEHRVFAVNCQLAGFEGGKGFIGGSLVYGPTGDLIAESPIIEEHLLMGEIDLDLIDIARANLPLAADLRSSWPTLKQVIDRMDG
ncbi:MAG: hypothetical protein KF784_13545 [Fimbriimonadaceae bacterium]|nr:hypothetical protein [Fimbriimonadaceae bacterium]